MKDWAAVANAVNERMTELGLKQYEVALRAGVAPATIRELQHNYTPRRRAARTLQVISEALDWPPGHIEAVLHHETPPKPHRVADGDAAEIAADNASIREMLGAITERLVVIEKKIDDLGRESSSGQSSGGAE